MEDCLVENIRIASRITTSYMEEFFLESEVRFTQFLILNAITEHAGESLTNLSMHLGMDRTTLTRLTESLEKIGLISICNKNKKRKYFTLTENGIKKYQIGLNIWNKKGKMLSIKYSDFLKNLIVFINRFKGDESCENLLTKAKRRAAIRLN